MMMLGDTGANLFGAMLGYMLVVVLPWPAQVCCSILLIGFHIYTERGSITRRIEQVPVLQWLDMLGRFLSEQPGIDMSWEMEPKGDDALVTIKIAKIGELPEFSPEEARGAISAVDALFDE